MRQKTGARKNRSRGSNRCVDCGAEIWPGSTRCQPCYHNLRRANKPTRKYPEGAKPHQRLCPSCGGLRSRDAKVCRRCADLARRRPRTEDPVFPKQAGHKRARRLYPLGSCEWPGCERAAEHRHHIDGNTLNNEPGNIARYCARHHLEAHGSLERFSKIARGRRKLTDDQVREIRSSTETLAALGRRFGVSLQTVSNVRAAASSTGT